MCCGVALPTYSKQNMKNDSQINDCMPHRDISLPDRWHSVAFYKMINEQGFRTRPIARLHCDLVCCMSRHITWGLQKLGGWTPKIKTHKCNNSHDKLPKNMDLHLWENIQATGNNIKREYEELRGELNMSILHLVEWVRQDECPVNSRWGLCHEDMANTITSHYKPLHVHTF